MRTPHSQKLYSIDDVIVALEEIIQESEKNHDPLGYFAVLYQKVTKKVKEGIENDFFDDGPRMEQLDIVFAERYIDAYYAYKNNKPVTASWKRAFELSSTCCSLVLQHLMVGINAHINLDLGIAAAEVSKSGNIDDLKDDFIRINEILASLVNEVEESLSGILPFLKLVIKRAKKLDKLVVDFIIKTARNSAWKFARKVVNKSEKELEVIIARRDRQTARIAYFIGNPGFFTKKILRIVRTAEQGSVPDKIRELRVRTYQIPAYAA